MLAAGLMGDAQVVLMDEPTNGIDADARAFLIDQITTRAHEHLVLFSTHDRDLIALTGARVLELSARDA